MVKEDLSWLKLTLLVDKRIDNYAGGAAVDAVAICQRLTFLNLVLPTNVFKSKVLCET